MGVVNGWRAGGGRGKVVSIGEMSAQSMGNMAKDFCLNYGWVSFVNQLRMYTHRK